MRMNSRGTVGFIALLGAELLVWDVKTVVWLQVGDPDYPLETLYSAAPVLPDARLPALTASNDLIAGCAPGHSISSGLDDAKNGFMDWLWVHESAEDRVKLAARAARRKDFPSPELFVSSDSVVTPWTAQDAAAFVRPFRRFST